MDQVKVRFPPSPTGLLHVGSARTALYNWLWARHTGGSLVLRFEDTDRVRSTDEAIDQALRVLDWLGITGTRARTGRPSGSSSTPRPRRGWSSEGKAYRCYCTPEELEAERDAARAAGRPLDLLGPLPGRAPTTRAGRSRSG